VTAVRDNTPMFIIHRHPKEHNPSRPVTVRNGDCTYL